MSSTQRPRIRRQDGQVLVVSALTLVVLLGSVGLVVDVGRAYLAQRQLQQAVDAAALAAGQSLPDSAHARDQAIAYSATGENAHHASMTATAPTVVFKCLQRLVDDNIPCQVDPSAGGPCATTGCNAVQVTQKASLPTLFARVFLPRFTVTARSTAGMRGGAARALDIMVVLDRTGSMINACDAAVRDEDDNVVIPATVSKKIDCAKAGVRQLLRGLLPCDPEVDGPCGTAEPLDEVGLMVFPPLKAKDATTHDRTGDPAHSNISLETGSSCSGELSSSPPWYTPGSVAGWFLKDSDVGYGSPANPADYTFAPLSNDYRTSPAQGLNPSSRLVQAITWASCTGLKGQGSGTTIDGFASETAQGYPGNPFYGINSWGETYYTGALVAAQDALAAEATEHPKRRAQRVIIFLSDGAANTGAPNPCASAVRAARAAAEAGTWVYSIAYKLDSSQSCLGQNGNIENPPIDAYTAMANIARNGASPERPDLTKFFCPGTTHQLPGLPCQSGDTLAEVFKSIGTSLTTSRIYPDDTQ